MTKRYPILALINVTRPFQEDFFSNLKDYFKDLFLLEIKEEEVDFDERDYVAVFAFTKIEVSLPQLLFSEHPDEEGIFITSKFLQDGVACLALSRELIQFYQKLDSNLLDHFPYQLRLADQKGDFLWQNHQFNGSFFPDQDQAIDSWILRQFQRQKDLSAKHFLLPFASLDHIYFQSYFALRDPKGHYLGSFDMVQDLKPILAHYLEETAQAIVGWSDVTSGPSISNDV